MVNNDGTDRPMFRNANEEVMMARSYHEAPHQPAAPHAAWSSQLPLHDGDRWAFFPGISTQNERDEVPVPEQMVLQAYAAGPDVPLLFAASTDAAGKPTPPASSGMSEPFIPTQQAMTILVAPSTLPYISSAECDAFRQSRSTSLSWSDDDIRRYLVEQWSRGEEGVDRSLPAAFPSSCLWRGIKNLRNTCYLGTAMQCIFYIPTMRKALIAAAAAEGRRDSSLPPLCAAGLGELFAQMAYSRSPDGVSPEKLVNALDLAPDTQQDAAEFFTLLMGWLEKEGGDTNLKETIDRSMRGKLAHAHTCKACGAQLSCEDPFLYLSVPIHRDLRESLREACGTTDVEGYHCQSCDSKIGVSSRTYVSEPPPTLLIHLSRFDFNAQQMRIVKKCDVVDCPSVLHLPLGMLKPHSSATPRYRLKGVLHHLGESASSGHYTYSLFRGTAVAGEPMWVTFNDSTLELEETNQGTSWCTAPPYTGGANYSGSCGFSFQPSSTGAPPTDSYPPRSCYRTTFHADKVSSNSAYVVVYQREEVPSAAVTSQPQQQEFPEALISKVAMQNAALCREYIDGQQQLETGKEYLQRCRMAATALSTRPVIDDRRPVYDYYLIPLDWVRRLATGFLAKEALRHLGWSTTDGGEEVVGQEVGATQLMVSQVELLNIPTRLQRWLTPDAFTLPTPTSCASVLCGDHHAPLPFQFVTAEAVQKCLEVLLCVQSPVYQEEEEASVRYAAAMEAGAQLLERLEDCGLRFPQAGCQHCIRKVAVAVRARATRATRFQESLQLVGQNDEYCYVARRAMTLWADTLPPSLHYLFGGTETNRSEASITQALFEERRDARRRQQEQQPPLPPTLPVWCVDAAQAFRRLQADLPNWCSHGRWPSGTPVGRLPLKAVRFVQLSFMEALQATRSLRSATTAPQQQHQQQLEWAAEDKLLLCVFQTISEGEVELKNLTTKDCVDCDREALANLQTSSAQLSMVERLYTKLPCLEQMCVTFCTTLNGGPASVLRGKTHPNAVWEDREARGHELLQRQMTLDHDRRKGIQEMEGKVKRLKNESLKRGGAGRVFGKTKSSTPSEQLKLADSQLYVMNKALAKRTTFREAAALCRLDDLPDPVGFPPPNAECKAFLLPSLWVWEWYLWKRNIRELHDQLTRKDQQPGGDATLFSKAPPALNLEMFLCPHGGHLIDDEWLNVNSAKWQRLGPKRAHYLIAAVRQAKAIALNEVVAPTEPLPTTSDATSSSMSYLAAFPPVIMLSERELEGIVTVLRQGQQGGDCQESTTDTITSGLEWSALPQMTWRLKDGQKAVDAAERQLAQSVRPAGGVRSAMVAPPAVTPALNAVPAAPPITSTLTPPTCQECRERMEQCLADNLQHFSNGSLRIQLQLRNKKQQSLSTTTLTLDHVMMEDGEGRVVEKPITYRTTLGEVKQSVRRKVETSLQILCPAEHVRLSGKNNKELSLLAAAEGADHVPAAARNPRGVAVGESTMLCDVGIKDEDVLQFTCHSACWVAGQQQQQQQQRRACVKEDYSCCDTAAAGFQRSKLALCSDGAAVNCGFASSKGSGQGSGGGYGSSENREDVGSYPEVHRGTQNREDKKTKSCCFCTFLNEASAKRCEMCDSEMQ